MCTHHDDKPTKRSSHVHTCCAASVTVKQVHRASASTPSWMGGHSYFCTPRINQPSPMRTFSPPLETVSTTVHSCHRLHQRFPRHGTSFPRSTIHIHVNVAGHPSHSSPPPLAQAFSHVRAEVAFQSNCFRRAESKNFVPRSAATCRLCRLSPVHPLWHVRNQRLLPRRCLRFAMPHAIRDASSR